MADLNDLLKPDATSNYSTEVLQTIKGHISRLWLGDYTGMGSLVTNMRRWIDSGTGDAKLVKRNSDGSESTIFDSSLKTTKDYVDAQDATKANAGGSNATGTWAINITGNAGTATTANTASTASTPASGGSFITSTNIGSQSVNYAASAGSASNGGVTSVNGSTGAVTVTNSGVTSAVAGNGVAVSGATGAVTFSVSAPSANSVGSYCFAYISAYNSSWTFGGNYSVGTSSQQIQLWANTDGTTGQTVTGSISGTWKWMGLGTNTNGPNTASAFGIAVRVA